MNTPFILTDDMLWDLADGLLTGPEKIRVEAYLAQNLTATQQFQAILNEKKQLKQQPLEVPQTTFSQQVMAAWVAEQPNLSTQSSANKGRDWIFWALLLALGGVFTIPFWLVAGANSVPTTLQMPTDYTLELPQVDLSALASLAWLRNLSILVLSYMGLMILDKYLQVKNVRFMR